jgi:hypothetical protein
LTIPLGIYLYLSEFNLDINFSLIVARDYGTCQKLIYTKGLTARANTKKWKFIVNININNKIDIQRGEENEK